MSETGTLESLMRQSPFRFVREYVAQHAIIGDVTYTHPDGSVMTRNQWYWSMKKQAPLWDRLTLEMAAFEREKLKPRDSLPDWLLSAEQDSFARQRVMNEVV